MLKYKDLFIDFDDTLYDTRNNAIIALRELYDELHLGDYFDTPEQFYEPYWQANMDLWAQYAKGDITREYLIIERFRRPLSCGRGANTSDEYCLSVSDRFLELCSCKPGVINGAHQLMQYLRQRGYRLHLCSNGFHEVQYKKLNACGLAPFFDNVILSEDAQANKPSRQFFDYALRVTGASPDTTLMIGDNYTTDIEGAMTAGIDTMLFQRWDPTFQPPRPVNYIVDTLPDIMKIL